MRKYRQNWSWMATLLTASVLNDNGSSFTNSTSTTHAATQMQRTIAKHIGITQQPPPLLRLLRRHSKDQDHNYLPTTPRPSQTLNPKTMEVEVKLRLPDAASHQQLSHLLSPFHTQTLLQENVFFDGAEAQLSSALAALRLRFYGGAVDSRCIISLKSKPAIAAGISRVEEEEEPIDPSFARACVAEPWRLLSLDSSRILTRVREEFGIANKGLVCLGGFKNVRSVYDWEGLQLELDETHYDFGTSYEIECESSEPDRVKKLLEEFLIENGISYSYSEVSKLAIFRSGKLPQ